MNEGILKFICAITGHDEDAIKQMFNDWLKSPSSNPDRASEVGVGCVVIASEQPDKVQANGAVAEVTHRLMDEQKEILSKANYTKNIIDGKINIDLKTQMELQNHFTKSMYEIFKLATASL